MALRSETRSEEYCRHCGKRLEALRYHWSCHTCGAAYCYIHMARHARAHPPTSDLAVLP